MKTKIGNPVDKKTIGKDVATVAGIGLGALAADIIDTVPFVQKQNPDVVDGVLAAGFIGGGMALKGGDSVTTGLKVFCFTVGAAKAYKMANRHFGPFGLPAGTNNWFTKAIGMNNGQVKSTAQSQMQLAPAQYVPQAAQTQNAFANAVLAQ